jgi:TorA maturation chaperone TorD
MNTTDVDATALRAAAAMLRLGTRTFASEVDASFYRSLQRLSESPPLRTQGLTPIDDRMLAVPTDEALDDLAAEYCRLFIGPHPTCPPYATAWQGGGALGMQVHRSLQTILHSYGLQPHLPPGVPIAGDDHIAVALALLDRLYLAAAGEPDAVVTPDRAANALLTLYDDYLMAWAPEFLAEVELQARCGPYRPVARMMSLLLRSHQLLQPLSVAPWTSSSSG